MSLMPLSHYRRLHLQDLQPTIPSIQLTDRSMKRPMGILEDVLVQMGKFVIPYNFIVLDMNESFQMYMILRMTYLDTARMAFNVQTGTILF